jgi:RNA polymerase sigma factor (sigma-70 family)
MMLIAYRELMTSTDSELLAAYVNNRDQDALRALLQRHLGLVYAAALRQIRDPGMAEDIVQGVFMALAAKAPSLHAKAAMLPAWLLVATRYSARSALRRRAARSRHEQKAAVMETTLPPTVDSEKLFSLLDAALNRLSSADRTAIALYYLENQSLRDVGNSLAVSEDAAQMRVSRALVRLRSILQRAGIACPADAFEKSLHRCGAVTAPTSLLAVVANSILRPAAASPGGALIAQHLLQGLLMKKIAVFALAAAIALAVAAPAVPLVYRAFSASPKAIAVSPANTPIAPTAPAAPSAPSPFIATLPNGISIELLGVMDYSSHQYWAPDGGPLQSLPQGIFGQIPSNEIRVRERYIAWFARREFPPIQDLGYSGHLMPTDKNYPDSSGDDGDIYEEVLGIPKDQTTGTIHFDFATGSWQIMVSSSGKETVTTHQAAFGDFVLNPATNSGNDLVVTLLTNIHGRFQDHFIAIERDGGEKTASIETNQTPADQMNEITARFNNLSLDQIQQIRYEVRYYDLWVEFQNVSLVPDKHTKVQIETGNTVN